MKYYEYDTEGFLIGWYEAETARPNSTQTLPLFPASDSRWVNGAWTLDGTREQQRDAEEVAERTRRQAAIAKCKAYDPATANATDVRATLGAALFILGNVVQELRPPAPHYEKRTAS